MELKIDAFGNIEIKGVIKTIEDVENIKEAIENNAKGDTVELKIVDSFAMPSALIGYLTKIHSSQNKKIRLKIGDEDLYELLKDLNLDEEFNIQKI